MRGRIFAGLIAGWVATGGAWGQNQPPGAPVVTYPEAVWACAVVSSTGTAPTVCSGNKSGTIGGTNIFQSVLLVPAGLRRSACTVQNQSSVNNMWVFPGPPGLATERTSVVLLPGVVFYCATTSGGVIQDQISITGTSGDGFYASQQ